jgi:hypothetical protein
VGTRRRRCGRRRAVPRGVPGVVCRLGGSGCALGVMYEVAPGALGAVEECVGGE